MSKIRMASGMVAAGIDIARGPTAALLEFIRIIVCGLSGGLWIVVKAVWRVIKVIFPWLLGTVLIAALAYFGYLFVNRAIEASRIAAEATKYETAFNESLEAAAESAEDLEINARVRALVGSRLAKSSDEDETCCRSPSKEVRAALKDEPDTMRECSVLIVASPRNAVKLMVIQTSIREYISVEVDGQQAYLCVVEDGEDLWPWIYKGIGLWEHLLEDTEAFVDKDRQQQEINSRFGEWKGEQK